VYPHTRVAFAIKIKNEWQRHIGYKCAPPCGEDSCLTRKCGIICIRCRRKCIIGSHLRIGIYGKQKEQRNHEIPSAPTHSTAYVIGKCSGIHKMIFEVKECNDRQQKTEGQAEEKQYLDGEILFSTTL
jgi:hypothetical protein